MIIQKAKELFEITKQIYGRQPNLFEKNGEGFSYSDRTQVSVKIKYREGSEPLSRISKGDWIDLRASGDYYIQKGEYRLIDLGVAMKLPKGYEALVVPRSSTFKNFGIISANSVGVIDNSYCGPDDYWKFPAIAMRDTHISHGDRVCQFRIIENQPMIEFEESDLEGEQNRGGIGSTGVK